MRRGTRDEQADNGQKRQPGIKWQSGIKMAEKGPKKFSRFMRHGTRGDQVEKGGQVEIGSQVEKRRPGKKWQKKVRKNFRALCAIVSEVTRYKKKEAR